MDTNVSNINIQKIILSNTNRINISKKCRYARDHIFLSYDRNKEWIFSAYKDVTKEVYNKVNLKIINFLYKSIDEFIIDINNFECCIIECNKGTSYASSWLSIERLERIRSTIAIGLSKLKSNTFIDSTSAYGSSNNIRSGTSGSVAIDSTFEHARRDSSTLSGMFLETMNYIVRDHHTVRDACNVTKSVFTCGVAFGHHLSFIKEVDVKTDSDVVETMNKDMHPSTDATANGNTHKKHKQDIAVGTVASPMKVNVKKAKDKISFMTQQIMINNKSIYQNESYNSSSSNNDASNSHNLSPSSKKRKFNEVNKPESTLCPISSIPSKSYVQQVQQQAQQEVYPVSDPRNRIALKNRAGSTDSSGASNSSSGGISTGSVKLKGLGIGVSVTYQGNQKVFTAAVDIAQRRISLGVFATPQEAARAHDLTLIRALGPSNCMDSKQLNYPVHTYASEPMQSFSVYDDILRKQLFGSGWPGPKQCDFSFLIAVMK